MEREYGSWTVLKWAHERDIPMRGKDGKRIKKALCKCECGAEKYVFEWHLQHGKSTSCGCSKRTNKKSLHQCDCGNPYFLTESQKLNNNNFQCARCKKIDKERGYRNHGRDSHANQV